MYRQLWVPVFALVACGLSLPVNESRAQGQPSPANELQAAQLMEQVLRNRKASPAEWQKMVTIYADLAKKYPKSPEVKNAYGALLWDQGSPDKAEEVWRSAVKLNENTESLTHLGAAALAKGEVKEAESCYTRACKLEPNNAAIHFDLGNLLFLFRKELVNETFPDPEAVMRNAMDHYAEACRLSPRNVDFARGRAETYYGLSMPDWREALGAWQHLFEISPQKDFALANLATVHLKLGERDLARECAAKMSSPEFATRKARILDRIERE